MSLSFNQNILNQSVMVHDSYSPENLEEIFVRAEENLLCDTLLFSFITALSAVIDFLRKIFRIQIYIDSFLSCTFELNFFYDLYILEQAIRHLPKMGSTQKLFQNTLLFLFITDLLAVIDFLRKILRIYIFTHFCHEKFELSFCLGFILVFVQFQP